MTPTSVPGNNSHPLCLAAGITMLCVIIVLGSALHLTGETAAAAVRMQYRLSHLMEESRDAP